MRDCSQHGVVPIDAIDGAGLTRRLAFIELMELLEFNVLRLDPPGGLPAAPPGDLIGTLDWWLGRSVEPPSARAGPIEDHAVYICSTTRALRQAVLPADDTLVHLADAAETAGPLPGAQGVRLYATARAPRVRPPASADARPPYLRVDLTTLLSRVVVPARLPQHMFELIQSVVRSRVWVDVVRP